MRTDYQSEAVHWYYNPGKTDWLLVTFNALNVGVNGRRFWGDSFAKKNDISALGIVATDANWFPACGMEAAVAAAKPILERHSDIVTYGTSMGAYGALKYSRAFGASTAIAFSPQFTIDPRRALPHDERYVEHFDPEIHQDVTITEHDLSRHANTYVFYDPYFKEDDFCALQIANLGVPVELVPMFLLGHSTIQPLAKDNRAYKLIEFCRRRAGRDLRSHV